MDVLSEIQEYLQNAASVGWNEFMKELQTEENKDYRRGFKAGLLCAQLQIKSQIGNIKDAASE